jgi:hypothetical protein
MIPKSGHRFSERIMRHQMSMIAQSGNRLLRRIMRQ